MSRPLRTTGLFALVTAAALVLGGLVLMQVLTESLRDAGLTRDDILAIEGDMLGALAALAAVLLGIAVVAGRAYARSLNNVREVVLARARDDAAPLPDFAVGELSELVSAVERLSAHVSTREARIEREGADLGALLDAISEGILQLDSAGRVVRANPAARVLLGLPQRAIGEPIATHIRNADLRRLLAAALTGGAVPAAEITLDDRRVIVSARPLAPSRGGSVIAFIDLTEVRRLESVRRDFVANVSHELKTPLTSIRGYVETLIADPDLPAAVQRQFLDVVHKNADRLHHIVDDLLDLSRLESGGWRPEPHDVNATDIVCDVWAACAHRAGDRRITFVPPAQPVTVHADPGGLRQVLTNLLDNALRYTPDGGRIEVRAAPVARNGNGRSTAPSAEHAAPTSAAQHAPAGYIGFEVRDTGSGIPIDALPRIFERFYRADPARSRAEGGTGLGLSIVRHLVERMGGDVAAESELGRGTIIRFRLPAAQ